LFALPGAAGPPPSTLAAEVVADGDEDFCCCCCCLGLGKGAGILGGMFLLCVCARKSLAEGIETVCFSLLLKCLGFHQKKIINRSRIFFSFSMQKEKIQLSLPLFIFRTLANTYIYKINKYDFCCHFHHRSHRRVFCV